MYVNESKRKLFGFWVNGKRTVWLSENEVQDLINKKDEKYLQIVNFSVEIVEKGNENNNNNKK